MANWTPAERNDGGVILGWYTTGLSSDVTDGHIIKDGAFTASQWRDRTPNGNHLNIGGASIPTGLGDVDNGTYLRFGENPNEWMYHENAYLLSDDSLWENITYFVVARFDNADDGRYLVSEGSTTDKSEFLPWQAGSAAQGSTAGDICTTLRAKDGTYRANQTRQSDLAWNAGLTIYSMTLSQADRGDDTESFLGGFKNGIPGNTFTFIQAAEQSIYGGSLPDLITPDAPTGYGFQPFADHSNWKGTGDRFCINARITDAGTTVQTSVFDMFALIIVRDCSKNLRQLIESYLAHRYDLAGNLPPGHPGADGPIQTGPETDPLASLVRSQTQFKGNVGDTQVQDVKTAVGLRIGFTENDLECWAFRDYESYVYEPGNTGEDTIGYWKYGDSGLNLRNNQFPGLKKSNGQDFDPNNPYFFWYRRHMAPLDQAGSLINRPLKSGTTAYWAGRYDPRVIELNNDLTYWRTRKQIRWYTAGLHSYKSDIELPGTNDFCIEFTFMPACRYAGNSTQGTGYLGKPVFMMGPIEYSDEFYRPTDGSKYQDTQIIARSVPLNVYYQAENGERFIHLWIVSDAGRPTYATDTPSNNGYRITYTVPLNEPASRPFEICIQRENKRIDFFVDGECAGSATSVLLDGQTEAEDFNYTNKYTIVNPDYSVFPSRDRDDFWENPNGGTTEVEGLGMCLGVQATNSGGTANYSYGSFIYDDWRYTLGAARYNPTERYNPSLQVTQPEQPTINTQPQDVYCYEGDTINFVCAASTINGTISYQWRDADTEAIVGTGGTLTLPGVPFVYPYRRFYCLVSNGLGLSRSRIATLFANPNEIQGIARPGALPDAPRVLSSNPFITSADFGGPLGTPQVVVTNSNIAAGPTPNGKGAIPSPLYPPAIVIAQDIRGQTFGENYRAVLIDANGNETRVAITSWQSTLSARSANYAQIVIPNAGAYKGAIADAVSFKVMLIQTGPGGVQVEFVMASVGTLQRTFSRGASTNNCTMRGYSEKFSLEEGAGDPVQLQGVRSYSSGETGTRVRCNVDQLIKPGRRVQFESEIDFVVGFVNQYANAQGSYMDVGE